MPSYNQMKKIVVAVFLVCVSIVVYILYSTEIYTKKQANLVCSWLIGNETTEPAVGPQALQHLMELRDEKKATYECYVEKSSHHYGYQDEMVVIVMADGKEAIQLIYGLGSGGRHFLQPRYFQHFTSSRHTHK